MSLKIGIAGAHSTGKSQFLARLRPLLEARGYRVTTTASIAAEAAGLGFPILSRHTFESTAWIMARGMQLELEGARTHDVVLVDRPLPDALGYYRAALAYRKEQALPRQREHLESCVKTFAPTYQLLIRTVLDEARQIDQSKPSDHDERFRRLAAQEIETVFDELALRSVELTTTNVDDVLGLAIGTVDAACAPLTVPPVAAFSN